MKKILAALALSITLLPLAVPLTARAQAGIYPFGGPILFAYPCVCTASYLIYVGPPNPGVFMLTPLSRLFMNFIFMVPGTYVLGTAATAPLACLNPPFCEPTGFGLPIIMMGTSL